jgi:hypothetical protein
LGQSPPGVRHIGAHCAQHKIEKIHNKVISAVI